MSEKQKKLKIAILVSSFIFHTHVDAENPMHEAAVVRLGKAMQIDEALSRGLEVGLSYQLKNHLGLASSILDCMKIDEMKRLTHAEWVRVYKNHLSEEEASAISDYLESPGGIKLAIKTRACWGGPGMPNQCDPVEILNDVERAALATFETSPANAALRRAQPAAQKELKDFSRELYLKESTRCMKLGR